VDAATCLSYLPDECAGSVLEAMGSMLKLLKDERKKVKDWVKAQITFKMIAAAQRLLVELNGQPVYKLKAL
jgi:hypothetical protein